MGTANGVSTAGIDDRVASVAACSGISDCELWLKQRQRENFDPLVREATRNELSQLKGGSGGKLFEVTDLFRIPKSDPSEPKIRGRTTRVLHVTLGRWRSSLDFYLLASLHLR